MALTFAYANAGSGPLANLIGWANFGPGFTLVSGAPAQTLTGTLANGATVSFNIALNSIGGGAVHNFTASTSPVNAFSYFGSPSGGYTGLNTSNVALIPNPPTVANELTGITISNIVVKDTSGNPITSYKFIVADAESTSGVGSNQDGLRFNTNGTPWTQLAQLGTTNPPNVIGAGTNSVGIIGVNPPPSIAYVYSSDHPTSVQLLLQWPLAGDTQGVAFGFIATGLSVKKNITGRRNPADQFNLIIGGPVSNTATTTGATQGLQPVSAFVSPTVPGTYTINEAMAPGSVSAITDYSVTVTGVNHQSGGTPISATGLVVSQPVALGDMIDFTITNRAHEIFTKTVDKPYAKPGDVLTYTVSVQNPNNAAISNVFVTDQTPSGTTYLGNIVVTNSAYTGTNLTSGITLTSIAANTTATVSWQVQVNPGYPVANPITNTANVTVPGGFQGPTNTINTQVNYADLTSGNNFTKSVTPSAATLGDTVTYTISVKNSGTVAANNVVITDALQSGTTYLPGTITGSVPFTGDPTTSINLSSPLAAGATATFTFNALIATSPYPSPNPIPNTASVAYKFTVDPAVVNGASGSGNSNTTVLPINYADLTSGNNFTKSVTPVGAGLGDTVTYTVSVTNSGNTAADNVVITDALQSGTSYVAGSVTGTVPFTGDPVSGIKLTSSLPAGATAIFTFKALISTTPPAQNPIQNTAVVNYSFIVDPANPVPTSRTGNSNTVEFFAGSANLNITKTADKVASYLGDTITYNIVVKNIGNLPADKVVLTDPVPSGTTLVPGSLVVSDPYTGSLATSISLTNPIAPGSIVTLSYKVTVTGTPNPNPIANIVTSDFAYTLDPQNPDAMTGTAKSNPAITAVFKYDFAQQINDLMNSVASVQAALGNIMNSEGAKVQKFAAMQNITPEQLLCLNKSVTNTLEAITTLEGILKQKTGAVNCQLDGSSC